MNSVREYRMPLLIGGGALVVALLIWVAVIAPQNSKLSSLQTKQVTVGVAADSLEVKLASLKSERQRLSSSCADLQKIATQIPTRAEPDRRRRRGVFLREPVQRADCLVGRHLDAVQRIYAGGHCERCHPDTDHTADTIWRDPSDVTPVPTTLTVTGNYGQISAFINGLDSFPRLFVIQNFAAVVRNAASHRAHRASGSVRERRAWSRTRAVGRRHSRPSPSAGPYSLAITGSIYYTSAPNALEACTKATASFK